MQETPSQTLTRSQAAEEAEDRGSNLSPNPTMGEIVAARYHRRDVLRGALAVTAIAAAVSPLALATAAKAQGRTTTGCTWPRATTPRC